MEPLYQSAPVTPLVKKSRVKTSDCIKFGVVEILIGMVLFRHQPSLAHFPPAYTAYIESAHIHGWWAIGLVIVGCAKVLAATFRAPLFTRFIVSIPGVLLTAWYLTFQVTALIHFPPMRNSIGWILSGAFIFAVWMNCIDLWSGYIKEKNGVD